LSCFRLRIATSAPCLARASAMPRPMPVPPPVTSATFPSNSRSRKTLIAILFFNKRGENRETEPAPWRIDASRSRTRTGLWSRRKRWLRGPNLSYQRPRREQLNASSEFRFRANSRTVSAIFQMDREQRTHQNPTQRQRGGRNQDG